MAEQLRMQTALKENPSSLPSTVSPQPGSREAKVTCCMYSERRTATFTNRATVKCWLKCMDCDIQEVMLGEGLWGTHTRTPRHSQRGPIPCLLDEANDKLAHFNGLVCLESDDLLQCQREDGSGHTKEHYLTFIPPPRLITHIQKVVKQGGVFVDDQLLDLGGTDIKPGSKVKHDGSCS